MEGLAKWPFVYTGSLFVRSTSALSEILSPVWVRLDHLPLEYFNPKALLEIGNFLGVFLGLDGNTHNYSKGSAARLCILLNISKPLPTSVEIDGINQSVQYDGVTGFCLSYGKVGHSTPSCSKVVQISSMPELSSGSEPLSGWTTVRKKRGNFSNLNFKHPHHLKHVTTPPDQTKLNHLPQDLISSHVQVNSTLDNNFLVSPQPTFPGRSKSVSGGKAKGVLEPSQSYEKRSHDILPAGYKDGMGLVGLKPNAPNAIHGSEKGFVENPNLSIKAKNTSSTDNVPPLTIDLSLLHPPESTFSLHESHRLENLPLLASSSLPSQANKVCHELDVASIRKSLSFEASVSHPKYLDTTDHNATPSPSLKEMPSPSSRPHPLPSLDLSSLAIDGSHHYSDVDHKTSPYAGATSSSPQRDHSTRQVRFKHQDPNDRSGVRVLRGRVQEDELIVQLELEPVLLPVTSS